MYKLELWILPERLPLSVVQYVRYYQLTYARA